MTAKKKARKKTSPKGAATAVASGPVSGGQKFVLLAMGAFLAAVFLASLWQRMEGQTLTIQVMDTEHEHGEMQAPDSMSDPMAQNKIAGLMQRMQAEPENVDVLIELGHTFMEQQSYENALQFLNKALVREPANTTVLNFIGVCMFNLERLDEAGEYFQEIVNLDPAHYWAVLNLGYVSQAMGKDDEAANYFQQVLDMESATEEAKAMAREQLSPEK